MAPDADNYLGCNLPLDHALTADGWEWRCNADGGRAREVAQTYEELGFEVRLVPVNVNGLSDACAGCRQALCTVNAIYVRKQQGARSTG